MSNPYATPLSDKLAELDRWAEHRGLMWVLFAGLSFVLGLLMLFGSQDPLMTFVGSGEMGLGVAWLIRYRMRRRNQ